MKWNLVYFDDQIQNIECYQMFLKDKFRVLGFEDATTYPVVLQNNNPHAFLLDVHMPVMDGYSLYQKIVSDKAYNGCPIIFISGDLTDEVKMQSYNYGGVDFLTRDMRPDEVSARLTSKIKLFLKTTNKLSMGNLTIDYEALKVFLDGESVDLTLFEMRLLSYLLRNMPDPLTRTELLQKILGDQTSRPGTINTHLSSIKTKLANWDHVIQVRQENVMINEKSV